MTYAVQYVVVIYSTSLKSIPSHYNSLRQGYSRSLGVHRQHHTVCRPFASTTLQDLVKPPVEGMALLPGTVPLRGGSCEIKCRISNRAAASKLPQLHNGINSSLFLLLLTSCFWSLLLYDLIKSETCWAFPMIYNTINPANISINNGCCAHTACSNCSHFNKAEMWEI